MTDKDKDRSRLATRPLLLLKLVLVLLFASTASAEWKEKVLYSFQGGTDGSVPIGGVVFDKQGNLYGATQDGGSSSCHSANECGTVFQLAPPVKKGAPWTETVLYVFKGNASNDGTTPFGGLVIDRSGNLYGTTAYGGTGDCVLLGSKLGCGTVYELSPPAQKGGAWTETVLYSLKGGKDGYFPNGDLVFDSAGNLYGATEFGGGNGTNCGDPYYQYCGTVFKLRPPKTQGGKWKEKVLYSFKGGTDGANPNGGLVLDNEGNIYGTSTIGGNESTQCGDLGCGTAFELKRPTQKRGEWTRETLHAFKAGSDGNHPSAGMIFGTNEYLYGTTLNGASGGTVFSLAPPAKGTNHWKETISYGFNENDGPFDPEAALIVDQSGNLYGTTYVGNGGSLHGSVFRVSPPGKNVELWTFHVIHGFLGPPDGDFPAANLVFDKSGDLYSTTQAGGTGTGCGHGGCGTVFEVSP